MLSKERFYFAPLEKAYLKIVTPFEEFIHRQTTTGILLITCAIIALVIANTALSISFDKLLHTQVGLFSGQWRIEHSIQFWINDGLMTVFFFVIGLEIKREFLTGDLSDYRKAILPMGAAIGGMVVPALIYFIVNGYDYGSAGWGIPMATDIAFAIGIMALLGDRIPKSLLTFLVALAIVDDLGAVTVIALFYTEEVNLYYLFGGFFIVAFMYMLNLMGIRRALPYFFLTVILWLFMEGSGVHATIAGIFAAWTIPAYSRYSPEEFRKEIRDVIERFDLVEANEVSQNNTQHIMLTRELGERYKLGVSPLQKLESLLHTPTTYLIIPMFALSNAAIPVNLQSIESTFTDPIAIGIILGLVFGKLVGITGSVYFMQLSGIGRLPASLTFRHIIGAGFMGGIGFTMSIFISELAFEWDGEVIIVAKMGILVASLIAGTLGYLWLRYFTHNK